MRRDYKNVGDIVRVCGCGICVWAHRIEIVLDSDELASTVISSDGEIGWVTHRRTLFDVLSTDQYDGFRRS
jgi:hypothetical protein